MWGVDDLKKIENYKHHRVGCIVLFLSNARVNNVKSLLHIFDHTYDFNTLKNRHSNSSPPLYLILPDRIQLLGWPRVTHCCHNNCIASRLSPSSFQECRGATIYITKKMRITHITIYTTNTLTCTTEITKQTRKLCENFSACWCFKCEFGMRTC